MNKLLTILLLALSVSVMGQTYSKDLEKSAKKGNGTDQKDLGICYLKGFGVEVDYKKAYKWLNESSRLGYADGLYYLATMYEQDIVPSKFSDTNKAWELYEQSAGLGYKESIDKLIQRYRQSNDSNNLIKWLKKDVESGNFISQFELGKLYYDKKQYSDAEIWLKKAANRGNAEAQYLVGQMYLEGKNGQPDNIKAKKYLQMATAQNFPNAQDAYSAIVYKEQQDSIAKARQAAIEQARRDSVARIRELELAAQKRQDSIDIAQGRKPIPYSWLISDCDVFRTDRNAQGFPREFERSPFYKRYIALCDNNLLAYFDKDRLDGLDQAAYKESEQYKSDLALFKKKKNEKLALIYPIKEEYINFHGDGISFTGICAVVWNFNENLQRNYRGIRDLVVPCVPSDNRTNSLYTFFKCNNTKALLKVREQENSLALLYIFKAGISVVDEKTQYGDNRMYISNPVGLYLINTATGEVALDLSPNLRKPNFVSEKKKIETAAIAKYKQRMRNGSSGSLVTRDVCSNCNGTGISVYLSGKREKCMACDGKGYREYRW